MLDDVVAAGIFEVKRPILPTQWRETESKGAGGEGIHVQGCHESVLNLAKADILPVPWTGYELVYLVRRV